MTTIRPATFYDVEAIANMAERFYPLSGYAELYGPIQRTQACGLVIVLMERGGVVLVAEKDGAVIGMACLHVEPFVFNPDCIVANEIAYWIEPEHRGGRLAVQMLRAIEDACREKGVHVIRMAKLATSPDVAAALYRRAGYVETESFFARSV